MRQLWLLFFFFFNDTATTEIYTLSLHDALPICPPVPRSSDCRPCTKRSKMRGSSSGAMPWPSSRTSSTSSDPDRKARNDTRSEEHTSELQSRPHLVCRLLLEKKKKQTQIKDILS